MILSTKELDGWRVLIDLNKDSTFGCLGSQVRGVSIYMVHFCENPAFCLRQCLHVGAPKTGSQNGPRAPLCPPKVALNVKGFTQEFCRKINPW